MTHIDTPFGRLDFGTATHVMAVINLSPDSKNAHTIAHTPHEALAMANRARDLGASIIDLGAQSSHLDNPTIEVELEMARLLPTLERLVDAGFIVSVDTWKPEVAEQAVDRGAAIINDTGGLGDERMRSLVAESGRAAVVMYVEGANPHAVGEISISDDKATVTKAWMEARIATLAAEGVEDLILDPGIAINYRGDYQAYTSMQLDVIRNLDVIRQLGYPVLIPIPRKREDHRVAAYIAMAIEYGADIIRVHDVEWACDLVDLYGRRT